MSFWEDMLSVVPPLTSEEIKGAMQAAVKALDRGRKEEALETLRPIAEGERLALESSPYAAGLPLYYAFGRFTLLSVPGAKDPPALFQDVARAVLEAVGEAPGEREVDELRREIWKQLPAYVAALDLERVAWAEINGPAEEDGCLWLDARAARVLEQKGGGAAKGKATAIRDASRDRLKKHKAGAGGNLWKLWHDPDEKAIGVRFILALGECLWYDTVAPRLKRSHVRAPTDIARTWALARGGRAAVSVCPEGVIVQPRDCPMQLSLPIEGVECNGAEDVELRRALKGGALQAYFAAWALWCDQGASPQGTFEWDERSVHEYIGTARDSRGQAAGRPRKLLREHLSQLLGMRVAGVKVPNVGTVCAQTPEPLINRYYVRELGDQGPNAYAHAPMLMIAMRHFLQIPRAVLRLDARRVPLAVGLAVVLRRKALDMLKAGHYRAPLRALLEEIGENHTAEARKRGWAYWEDIAERLAETAQEGELAAVHVAGGGPDAVVTLTFNPRLGAAYAPILEGSKAHAKEDTRARRQAKTLEHLSARKGRPHRGTF